MSFWKKLTRLVSGNANDALDASFDPGTEARQIVRERAESIATAESALTDVLATYEVLLSKCFHAKKEVDKWQTCAITAVDRDDQQLARDCLEAKRKAQQQVELYEAQIHQIEPQVRALEKQVDDLRAEHQRQVSEVDVIQARSDVSRASQKASETISGIGNSNLSGDFDRIRDTVLKQEAKAKVMADRADQTSGKSLENRVKNLSDTKSVDEELAELLGTKK